MKHLPTPLSEALERDLEEERVHQLWRGTEVRLQRRPSARRPLSVVLAVGVLGLAALVGAQLSGALRGPVATVGEPPVSLTLADGSAPVMVRTGAAARALRFADGSTVTLSASSTLVPLANDVRELALGLDAGRVDVDVMPGGGRRWRIVCGPVAVDVIGTRFAVERRPSSVLVDVAHGIVRVSGASLPAGAALVHAGESIEVEVDLDVATPLAVADLAVTDRAVADVAPPEASRERVASAARSAPHEALATPPAGVSASLPGPATARELLASADEARLADRPADAIAILEELLATHADDAEAPLGAIILARLERARGHHARAAEVLRVALELGVPRTLDEETRAERIRELDAAGAREPCAAEAQAYLDTYPDGAHAADARRCLLGP